MPSTRITRSARSGPRNGWIAIAIFALAVALLGGSSRPDAVQIAALRPIAALFLIPALYFATRENIREIRAPLFFFIGLLLLMVIQLVPLPAAIWSAIPGRESIADLSEIVGIGSQWRPLSLVPARTMNALASLVVPLAGLLLIASIGLSRAKILLLLIALGVADAVLGIAQIIAPTSDALFPYAITNKGTAVGIFANQNHSAVFGAVTLLSIGYLLSSEHSRKWLGWQKFLLFGAFMFVLLTALSGGSRAGLLTTILAVAGSAAMFWLSLGKGPRQNDALPMLFGRQLRPSFVFGAGAGLVALIVAAFLLFDQVPALRALTDIGGFEDLRWRLLPALQEMIATYWLLGSGFGSFEEVYHIFEVPDLLGPAYVNQAHNDWAQLLIEGGVLAAALVLGLIVWMVRHLLQIGRSGRLGLIALIFWTIILAIILFASLVDYPLRTPLFQFYGAALLALFCKAKASAADTEQSAP